MYFTYPNATKAGGVALIPAAIEPFQRPDCEADEIWLPEMAWTVPAYPKVRVNWAGEMLVRGDTQAFDSENDFLDAYFEALNVVNNWRSSHSFPLNTMTVGLRRRAKEVDPRSIVAQRIKRLSSIELKLARFQTMTLAQMQDIGGCRAILATVPDLQGLVHSYRHSEIKHQLQVCDDYVARPKGSGYRGIHLIYKYFSDRKQTYNTLRVEMQLRTHLQHAWATAVETVGTLQQQALKSSQGEQDWLRFFALASSAFAFREGCSPVPETPDSYRELIIELRDYAQKLDLKNRLSAYGDAMRFLSNPQRGKEDNHYFLLELNPAQKSIEVTTFKVAESKWANDKYLEVEKKIKNSPGAEAVLVSVESLDAVRRAYPNYFLDTHVFVNLVEQATRSLRAPKRRRESKGQLRLFS